METRTAAEFIEALAELLFDDDIEMTDEDIDEELRAFGYDPDELGERFAAVAAKALKQVRVTLDKSD